MTQKAKFKSTLAYTIIPVCIYDYTVKPRVEISLATGGSVVLKGSESELRCKTECSPECTTVKWYKNGTLIPDVQSTTQVPAQSSQGPPQLAPAQSSQVSVYRTVINDHSIYSCQASNSLGVTAEELAVRVHCMYQYRHKCLLRHLQKPCCYQLRPNFI